MTTAIGQLPEREALVMSLYYDEELNLKEIGEVLGVSESRVCQIHGQALTRLRARLHDFVFAPEGGS
jgi:RNA polymerase sigma factor for flagellar operon FliA